MEELWAARHAIWKRTLAQQQQGMSPSRALVLGKDNPGIESSGFAQDGRVTADMLEGVFWGKPKGSVETADLGRQATNLNAFLAVLVPLMQVNPAIRMVLGTVPAAKALIEQAIRVNRFPDKQALLGSEANGVFDQLQQQQQMMADPRMQLLMAAAGGGQPQGQPPAPGAAQQPQNPMPLGVQ
jgi:hypothetical protein